MKELKRCVALSRQRRGRGLVLLISKRGSRSLNRWAYKVRSSFPTGEGTKSLSRHRRGRLGIYNLMELLLVKIMVLV